MNAHTEGDRVVVGGDARQRFHDNSGYGEPRDGALALTGVEAAHLLARGELDAVDGADADAFIRRHGRRDPAFLPTYLVYRDLRERGFYPGHDPSDGSIPLPPRGTVPAAADAATLRTVDPRPEGATVAAAALGDRTVAAVDDDGDVTYLRTAAWDGDGAAPALAEALAAAAVAVPDGGVPATVVGDGVLLDDEAVASVLEDRLALGAPTPAGLRLTAAEASYLDTAVGIDADLAAPDADPADAAVYNDLRERGLVPRTGFKFGAALRCYADVDPEEGHSEQLFRTLRPGDAVPVGALAGYARLARGVRKRAVYAVTDGDGNAAPRYVAVERDRP